MKILLSSLLAVFFIGNISYASEYYKDKYYVAINVYVSKAGATKDECQDKIQNIKNLIETAKGRLDTDGNVKYNVRCLEKN